MRPLAAQASCVTCPRWIDRAVPERVRFLQIAWSRRPLRRQTLRLLAATLLFAGGATPTAAAVDQALPAAVLVEHCRGYAAPGTSTGATLCEAYLRGYLAGASSAGWLLIQSASETTESFTKRASRTRLGSWTQPARQRSCLSSQTTMPEFVGAVLRYADSLATLDDTSAQQLLEGMLRATFPCRRATR